MYTYNNQCIRKKWQREVGDDSGVNIFNQRNQSNGIVHVLHILTIRVPRRNMRWNINNNSYQTDKININDMEKNIKIKIIVLHLFECIAS